MSDDVKQYFVSGKKNLIFVYLTFLGGILIPLLPVIGAAFSYSNKGTNDRFLSSHYVFAFRTFIVGFVVGVLMLVPPIIFISPIIYFFLSIWVIVRSIIAVQYLMENNPHPNPLSFWIK